MTTQPEVYENKTNNKGKSKTMMIYFFLGKNYKIEFILDDVAWVESRPFSLPAQSVSSSSGSASGSSSGGSSGSSSGSSSSSRASAAGTAARITTLISCLMGRVLLLEIFMAADLTLNVNLGKHSSIFLYMMYVSTYVNAY